MTPPNAGPALRALRQLAACAVLVGLFAMHGLPSGAGPGCHAAAGAVEAISMPRMTPHVAAPRPAGPQAAPVPPGGAQGSGGTCVSTAPRLLAGLAGPGLLAMVLLAVMLLAPSPSGPGGRSRRGWARRGPPPAGVVLLTRLCVSRT